MKNLNIFLLSAFLIFFFYCESSGQANLNASEYVGEWVAKIPPSSSGGMAMMLDGSAIKLNDDFTFSAKIMQDIEGSWTIEGETIRLNSSDFPSEIVLIELSIDSCIWHFDNRERIPFYKKFIADIQNVGQEDIYVAADSNEILGRWINTQIEDPTKSMEYNATIFGDFNNDYLELNESGNFWMTRSIARPDGVKTINGKWTIDNDQVVLNYNAGKVERLGVLKSTADTLVLLANPDALFAGSSTFKFIYTRKIAAGLSKYLVHANVLDTINEEGIQLELKLPEGFSNELMGVVHSDDNHVTMTVLISQCYDSNTFEEALALEKKGIASNVHFVRFRESNGADFLVYERMLISSDYEVVHLFAHNEVIYCLKISSFLLENVLEMIESLKNKRILK